MNTRFVVAIAMIGALASTSAFGQQDWEIVIDPKKPTSRDLITISVTNSSCYSWSEFREDLANKKFEIHLDYYSGLAEECRANNPNAPDFSRTVGPLEAGTYSSVFFLRGNTRPLGIRATKSFIVAQAPPADVLSDGGITGFYYNPADDGHYVYILQTDYTTLVVWNTFGPSGSPRWVYGVGELQRGGTIVAETYINRSDGFSGGDLRGLQVVPWGTLEVEMESCFLGTVRYDSHLPEFGSGEFPIRRLAFSKQIGCEEID